MKLAVYGRNVQDSNIAIIKDILNYLHELKIETLVHLSFLKQIQKIKDLKFESANSFTDQKELKSEGVNCLISIGGDGTLLDTVTLVGDSGIPVMGINAGRLGFLANISKHEIRKAIDQLIQRHYSIEKRTLLSLESNKPLFEGKNFALNDFTIHKRDTAAMITIHTFLNGEPLNTYWADGLVVSTPTGSTAYSLSCGGPIIFPDAKSFSITAVASHNISIRPIIVPDHSVISFEVEGRGKNFLVSLDSRYEVLDYSYQLAISREKFHFNLIKLNDQNFISTIREKLMLGIDNRNH